MANQFSEGRRVHLLIVDDDQRIRAMMSRYFDGEGFRTSAAASSSEARAKLAENAIDLALVDLGLPDDDGLTLVREVRALYDIGIIIVTGRSDEIDRIIGLEVGADDYVGKPFNLREMLARVRSVLRRLQPAARPAAEPRLDEEIHSFDGWRLDRGRRELSSPTGVHVPLTTGEFDMLCVFIDNAGRVLTRDFLLDQTRGRTWEAFDRTIDAQISRLRRKFELEGQVSPMIRSVRGVGYMFAARVDPA